MAKMTGGQALAKSLYREGVRVIFGLVGAQLYYATDALYDEQGKVPLIDSRTGLHPKLRIQPSMTSMMAFAVFSAW